MSIIIVFLSKYSLLINHLMQIKNKLHLPYSNRPNEMEQPQFQPKTLCVS